MSELGKEKAVEENDKVTVEKETVSENGASSEYKNVTFQEWNKILERLKSVEEDQVMFQHEAEDMEARITDLEDDMSPAPPATVIGVRYMMDETTFQAVYEELYRDSVYAVGVHPPEDEVQNAYYSRKIQIFLTFLSQTTEMSIEEATQGIHAYSEACRKENYGTLAELPPPLDTGWFPSLYDELEEEDA